MAPALHHATQVRMTTLQHRYVRAVADATGRTGSEVMRTAIEFDLQRWALAAGDDVAAQLEQLRDADDDAVSDALLETVAAAYAAAIDDQVDAAE